MTGRNVVSVCDVCATETEWSFVIRNVRDPLLRLIGIRRADFWVCRECGLVRQIPKPPAVQARSVYESTSFRPESAREARRGSMLARTAPDQYRWVISARGGEVPGTVFDVGAGTGALLDEFKTRGWQTAGVEPTAHFAEYAASSGHAVTVGFLNGNADGQRYDVVTASHVLEHVPTPGQFLHAIRQRMRDDSCLFIEVPDVTKPYGHIWHLFFSVNHVYHYNAWTLSRLLANHGFHVTAVERGQRGVRVLCRPGQANGVAVSRVTAAEVVDSIRLYRETAFRATYLRIGIKDDLKLAFKMICGDRIYDTVRRAVRPRAGERT